MIKKCVDAYGELHSIVPLNFGDRMKITLIGQPTEDDWMEVKRRALVTVGLSPVTPPNSVWRHKILRARHSPIRYLRYSFLLEGVPYWVSTHLARHIHAQPYIKSQRNDRQSEYDRNKAPQDALVDMIWDTNAEELMVIANKRLCLKTSHETRDVVRRMCSLAEAVTPELAGLLVPMCERCGGICYEMEPCKKGRYSMRNHIFPQRLRALRERNHPPPSQKTVSELMGLSPDAIRRYERGEAEPKMETEGEGKT